MAPPITPARSRLRTAAVCGLLFGGTILLFWRATGFGFLNYDDPTYLTDNAWVQGGLSWGGVVWAFTARADYWHPLTWLAHMLDWQLYGPAGFGHHLTSVGWHAVNAVLAFLVFRRLTGGFWRSAFAAALFAWHPLRVESVVWITERKDVMSGCFFLLTVLAYGRYVARRAAGESAWRSYGLSLLCFAAGLMSKPMVVTIPLVLLLLDFWPFARCPTWAAVGRVVVEKLPFLALSSCTAIVTLVMQRQSGAFVLEVPFGARLGNAVVSIARYLGKFAWPEDLIVCYSHPGYWPAGSVLAAAAFVLGLGSLAWWQRRSRPWIAVGLGWFVVTLLPVIGLVQVGFQAMADRYTYLPLLGVELAVIGSLPVSRSRLVLVTMICAGIAMPGACAWRTWQQEAVWRDSITLFEHAVTVSSRSDVAEDFLASALYAAGRIDDAAVHAGRACALNPRNVTARITLASAREQQGRLAEAAELYRSALALRPENPPVQCELGVLEFAAGHTGEARRLMTTALRAAPALAQRTLQVARTALQNGDWRVARFNFEVVLEANPDDVTAHVGLGYLLITSGDRAAGVDHWRRALELEPNFPGLRERLAKEQR